MRHFSFLSVLVIDSKKRFRGYLQTDFDSLQKLSEKNGPSQHAKGHWEIRKVICGNSDKVPLRIFYWTYKF